MVKEICQMCSGLGFIERHNGLVIRTCKDCLGIGWKDEEVIAHRDNGEDKRDNTSIRSETSSKPKKSRKQKSGKKAGTKSK